MMTVDYDSMPPKRYVLMERRVIYSKVIMTLNQILGSKERKV